MLKLQETITHRFRLPEGVDYRAPLLSDHVVVPLPGLGVDGLSDRPQNLQRASLVPAHKGTGELPRRLLVEGGGASAHLCTGSFPNFISSLMAVGAV